MIKASCFDGVPRYAEWHHPLFNVIYSRYVLYALRMKEENPTGYKELPKVRFFDGIRKAMNNALADPTHKRYLLGNTLGEAYRRWRRIKNDGLPDRYRLFFQFSTEELKVIFCWLNDQSTMRKKGSKTDVYVIFKKLLENGKIPSQFSALLNDANQCM
ncbi:type II toxin-antitoxin system YhaV family toxin [Desulfovibrio cuneatus]|uniref:type II toxin-antitoxin system YhaV family toxin n=1 Tax=Desulfovibrio cuneatus TaxID=159728 RepID=UPI000688F8D2|nr:type II toxin-antitoxin system YhaV family toxin [Desulfovibrio cuneatus]